MNWKRKKVWSSFNIAYSSNHKAHVIKLDNRLYLTRSGKIFKIPNAKLAKKVAREWEKITVDFSQTNLPVTNILEQIQEVDKKLSETYLREILEYANTDLICYRVQTPEGLRKLQEKRWDPILEIYYEKYGIELVKTYGVTHVMQEKDSMKKFCNILDSYNPQKRFIVYKITHLLGSALLSILIEKKIIDKSNAWGLSRIEEDWQKKLWGTDEESLLAEKNKRKDFDLYITCLQSMK